MKAVFRALSAILALLVTLIPCGCGTILDPTEFDVDAFGPTPESVRRSLEEDRVRQAREEAAILVARYPNVDSEMLFGLALWRNGELVEAEPRLRRAAEDGYPTGVLAMARLRAAAGDRSDARSLAVEIAEDDDLAAPLRARARALLAGLEWMQGTPERARVELEAWARLEPDPRLAAVADAAAAAVASLGDLAPVWSGRSARLELHRRPVPNVVRGTVGGLPARLAIRPSVTQSYLSPDFVERAGLTTHGSEGEAPPSRQAEGDRDRSGSRADRDLGPEQLNYAGRFAVVRDLVLGDATIRATVVAVWTPPEGIDGVLGADLLMRATWELDVVASTFAVAPPPETSPGPLEPVPSRVVAWAGSRRVVEGLTVQLMAVPRIGPHLLATTLEPAARSRLEPGPVVGSVDGSGSRMTDVRLGGYESVVSWDRGELTGRALGGGVAPWAELGGDFVSELSLFWDPLEAQFALVRPRSGPTRP